MLLYGAGFFWVEFMSVKSPATCGAVRCCADSMRAYYALHELIVQRMIADELRGT
jgi:hypothetical protein